MHKNFYLALLGIGIGGIGFGLITPVTVLLLEQNKAPAIITGSITMVGYLSVVIFSPVAGLLINKYNLKKVLGTGLFLWSIGALAHIFWYIIPLLYLIKFLMGIGGTLIFVSTEVIINYYSDENNRGKNVNLYAVILSIGIALGSILIWTIKIATWLPFVIGALVMLSVFLFQVIFFEDINVNHNNSRIAKISFTSLPLLSIIAPAVYGFFESSIIVVIPMYGLRNLFNVNQVSYFIASFVTGGIVLLYFIGFISDIINRQKLLLFIFFLLSNLLILPSIYNNFIFLIITFFLIGGMIPAIYTVGLSYTIEKVEKQFIAQANGYYIMMYGIGTIAGPFIGALLVDINKQFGFWLFSAILCFLLFAFFRWYGKQNS
ncbi:MFS transporter [Rosettibacter firmus]|uniref:MFS transporter n=1 Tax=Rosettibacter firmus TaxID=3111522 RepID=UPI00336C15EB